MLSLNCETTCWSHSHSAAIIGSSWVANMFKFNPPYSSIVLTVASQAQA